MNPYRGYAGDTCRAMLPILREGARTTDDPIRYWAGVVLYIAGCMGGDIGFRDAAHLLRSVADTAEETGEIIDDYNDESDGGPAPH